MTIAKPSPLIVTTVILASYFVFRLLRFGHRDKRLPPGPPTLPILGNAHQIPSRNFHKKVKEWSDHYGKIFSLKIGAGTIIVLNDRRAVHDLVDKRSAIYSDRPLDHNIDVVMGGENTALMNATPLWRAERKVISQMLTPTVLDDKIGKIQNAEISQLMHDLLNTPENFSDHIMRTTSSISSILVFGHRSPTTDCWWNTSVYHVMDLINQCLEPGSYLPIEQFPILKLIPDRWAPSKARAKQSYQRMTATWIEARRKIGERRAKGDHRISLADRLLSRELDLGLPVTDHQICNFFGTVHQAAADTTSAILRTAMLFLAKHPWVQEKARLELDRVCGTDRMPQWSDFDAAPYINCIMKENLRIRPVGPVGFPHRASRDDYFDGMLIPKDASIIIPAWALQHTDVEDPESYNPDRYLYHPKGAMYYAGSPDYMKRDHYAYGAGRRICVGIHLAERTQWRVIARLLWAFKIEPAVDDNGTECELDQDAYRDEFVHQPRDFRVTITPRSERHAQVVLEDFKAAEDVLKQWE
ncbi:cytochrome P450 oxidoreductase-like protein [Clohesyomyces aquaticus]|uniref:Cytochrome P450 oxidoreductase-like protein n=1 Tax=Clohesyomyces aquaticus TaxID=1231657 RepID=A0A1Y1YV33_9PLEO|nr:cytochrome P450 oxidoreductase-like protein [Clohesyomyces aquaticus]